MSQPCSHCNHYISARPILITCSECNSHFHVKCAGIATRNFSISNAHGWLCHACNFSIFPMASLSDEDVINEFSLYAAQSSAPRKKTKCGSCKKGFAINNPFAFCNNCSNFYHLKCSDLKKQNFPLKSDWQCDHCCLLNLPYASINDDVLSLTTKGYDDESILHLKNYPSFSIKTLLDEMPGQKIETDEFISDTIQSKYYTPAEFISTKFNKKSFTIIHLNISSLYAHIDELRTLVQLLNHPFDVICISETRIHEDMPLTNIEIENYSFYHTPTPSHCGGVAIYIKSNLECELLTKYSTVHPSICESIFLEIKNKTKKNIIIGCVYRHPSPPISSFSEEYFESMLRKLTKLNKKCILAGDFNIDLIKYDSTACVSEFYDQISSYGFRPLILQPTRFSTSSATLIDNIFINDLSCFSNGGNITTSISDHLMQFAQLDILENLNNKTIKKVSRNWRVFNRQEFQDELGLIPWTQTIDPNMDTNQSFSTFFDKITHLLDEMAPMKTLSKKQIKLTQKPWITSEI